MSPTVCMRKGNAGIRQFGLPASFAAAFSAIIHSSVETAK